MSSFFKYLSFLSLLVLAHSLCAQTDVKLHISEIMASNQSTLMDADGEYSDWIELQNNETTVVNLEGWYLSDDPSNPIKWLMPEVILNPGQFIVIFASGKDRRSGELHANFRLSALGETIILVQQDGTTVQSALEYPTQYSDIAYGLLNDEYAYLDQPTPGLANIAGEYLDPPTFSVEHGLYQQPFNLTMSSSDNDATIRYTLNGSAPSLTNGIDYVGSLLIDSTAVVRAVVVKQNKASLITSSTYIFPEEVVRQPATIDGYPSQWAPYSQLEGYAPADYEMDPEICQSPAYKDLIVPSLMSIPTIAISANTDHLFSHNTDPNSGGIYIYTDPPTGGLGEGWERPVSVEYILPAGDEGFQIDCGLRIHGGHSRLAEKSPKKSFRLVFDDDFGPDGLKYNLFTNSDRDIFNTLILRAGFNQTWFHWNDDERIAAQYINDSWAKDMHRKMDHISAHNQFVHIYINGLYWGLYDLCERMDDNFMAHYLGGERQDYDAVKDYAELAEGNLSAWNQLMMQADRGFVDPDPYYAVQGKDQSDEDDPNLEALLDVDNLIDYMILNFYMGNKDWDHHNWIAFRNRVDPERGFQFAPWDSERTFNGVNVNIVDENNEERPSYLYSQLRQSALFRRQFADRANELLGSQGFLGPDSARSVWMDRADEIDLAILAESARWGDYRRDMHQHKNEPYLLYTKNDHWSVEQQRLLNEYFPKRSAIVLEQLAEIGLAGEVVTDLHENEITTTHSSYPNPFNSFTTISFRNDASMPATVDVLDTKGQIVASLKPSWRTKGRAEFTWRPIGLDSGMYFYRISLGEQTIRGKLLYVK